MTCFVPLVRRPEGFFLQFYLCYSIIVTTDNAYGLVCRNYFIIVKCRMQEASIPGRVVWLGIKLSVSRFREFIQLVE